MPIPLVRRPRGRAARVLPTIAGSASGRGDQFFGDVVVDVEVVVEVDTRLAATTGAGGGPGSVARSVSNHSSIASYTLRIFGP